MEAARPRAPAPRGAGSWLILAHAWGVCLAAPAAVVSVPDLHGDYERAVQVLSAAGLVDPGTLEWTGRNVTLVQTGDIVDRGSDGKKIYELFFRLAGEAQRAGGSVVNLLGNHELMNLQQDLRYVSQGDFEAFGGRLARQEAWAPDGWLGQRVRTFPAAALAGGVLFVHAGLLPRFLDDAEGLRGLNDRMLAAVAADARPKLRASAALLEADGPVWTREYPEGPDARVCAMAEDVLRRVGAFRMVVGHTIQEGPSGFRVRTRCSGRVVLADTAISRAYGGEPSYVEHDGEGGAVAVYPGLGLREPLPPLPAVAVPGAPGASALAMLQLQAAGAPDAGPAAAGRPPWLLPVALPLSAAVGCLWWRRRPASQQRTGDAEGKTT